MILSIQNPRFPKGPPRPRLWVVVEEDFLPTLNPCFPMSPSRSGVGNLLSTEGHIVPFLRSRGRHDHKKHIEEILLAHYILISFAILLYFIFLSMKVYIKLASLS